MLVIRQLRPTVSFLRRDGKVFDPLSGVIPDGQVPRLDPSTEGLFIFHSEIIRTCCVIVCHNSISHSVLGSQICPSLSHCVYWGEPRAVLAAFGVGAMSPSQWADTASRMGCWEKTLPNGPGRRLFFVVFWRIVLVHELLQDYRHHLLPSPLTVDGGMAFPEIAIVVDVRPVIPPNRF